MENGLKYLQIAEKMLDFDCKAKNQLSLESVYRNEIKKMATVFLNYLQFYIEGVDAPEEKARIADIHLSDWISHYLVPYLGKKLNLTNKAVWRQMLVLEKEYADLLANTPIVTLTEEGAYVRLPQHLSTIEKSAYQNQNITKEPEKSKWRLSTLLSRFFQGVAAFFSPGVRLPEGNIKRTAPGWITYLASPVLYTVTFGQFSLFNRYTENPYQSAVGQLNETIDPQQSNKKVAHAYHNYVQNPEDNEVFSQFIEICSSHLVNEDIVYRLLPQDKEKTATEKISALFTVSEKMGDFFDEVASQKVEDYPEKEQPDIKRLYAPKNSI